MTSHANPVQWTKARIAEICDECLDPIQPGATMAEYDDVFVDGRTLSLVRHGCIKRTYCEPCGHLLEDSLTTTEA